MSNFLSSIRGTVNRNPSPGRGPASPGPGGLAAPQNPHQGRRSPGPQSPTADYAPRSPRSMQSPTGPRSSETPLYLSRPFVKAALTNGNFKTIVALPKYCDLNEWVAVNLFDFFNNLNLFYELLVPVCTKDRCRTMTAGPNLDYFWIDADRKKIKLPAPTYINLVMSWVESTTSKSKEFPRTVNGDFPPTFPSTAKGIYRQLLRVFAHMYHAHFAELIHVSMEGHFNSLFAHFLAFGRQYNMLDQRDLKGRPNEPVGVGELWEKWTEMGILET